LLEIQWVRSRFFLRLAERRRCLVRKIKVFLTALTLLALFPASAAFSGGSPGTGSGADRVPTETEKRSDELAESIDSSLINANSRFAFEIFQELASEESGTNVFISPLSILLALAMTYNGAAGNTNLAMAEALQFSEFELEEINRGFSDLTISIVDADEQVEISIANSIWYRLGFEVEEDFIDRNESYYGSEVRELDFTDPQASDTINRWIDDATKGKIEQMIDAIPPDAMMYLINTIYFKGDWTVQFSENETRDGEFNLASGGKKMVPMMHMEEQFQHAEARNLGILRLPYGRENLAMYILLPDEGANLDEIIGELDEESWNRLTSELVEKEVTLAMPRYKVEYEMLLNDGLIKIGMGPAFGSQADFSGIAPGIFISRVLHKAVIEVNERGSEAAAATVVEMTKSAPSQPVEFIVDRPFFFTITDDRTGSILFMGKVAEP
jgi:serine protease inhibitor